MTDIPRARELIMAAHSKIKSERILMMHGRLGDPGVLSEVLEMLERAKDLMTRTIVKQPTEPKRHPLTEIQKEEIRQRVRDNPNLSCDDLAKEYNVAGGRISEALRGK